MFPYQGWPFGARPGFRDEVELLLDGKDAAMDAIAGALHQLHTMDRGFSPGGHCGHHGAGAGNEGGGAHDAHAGPGQGTRPRASRTRRLRLLRDLSDDDVRSVRSSISYWQTMWNALYANAPCLPCAMAQGLAPLLNRIRVRVSCRPSPRGAPAHGGGHTGGGAGREPIRCRRSPG